MVFTWTAFGENGSMTIGGTSRNYIIHVPSGLPANPALVLDLHGMSSNASQQEQLSGMDKVADQDKFIVVYPNSDGSTWDLSAGGNDVKYVAALIDTGAKGMSQVGTEWRNQCKNHPVACQRLITAETGGFYESS